MHSFHLWKKKLVELEILRLSKINQIQKGKKTQEYTIR